MYMLVSLSDTLEIKPKDFSKPGALALEDVINTKYADRVIYKVGLVVCFHSIISASEGLIGHGTGTVHVNVDFRVIVFRPFKGEIIAATITSAGPIEGVNLSLGFFDELVVPPETLFENSSWEADAEVLGDGTADGGGEGSVWVYKSHNEETGEENSFYFDRAEKCLVRIEEERWLDMPPQMGGQLESGEEVNGWKKVPYLIRGSMMHSGLGPRLWWEG